MRILGLLLAVLMASPAFGQMACAPPSEMAKMIADRFHEAPVLQGVVNSGGYFRLFANGATGTWTAALTSPDGKQTCLFAAGDGLEYGALPKVGQPM